MIYSQDVSLKKHQHNSSVQCTFHHVPCTLFLKKSDLTDLKHFTIDNNHLHSPDNPLINATETEMSKNLTHPQTHT